jgi:hypothetical protein
MTPSPPATEKQSTEYVKFEDEPTTEIPLNDIDT